MDFNPPDEIINHPIIPRCTSAISRSSSIDFYELNGETSSLSRSSSVYSLCSFGFGEPSTYGNIQSCPSDVTNEYISPEQIHHAINFNPTSETRGSPRSSAANSLSSLGFYEPFTYGADLPRSSSAISLPSSLGLYEPSTYLNVQLCPSNHTNEYMFGVLPEPIHLDTNYQPSTGVEFRPTIRREAHFNIEEFSGCNQHSMQPVLGPRGETHWEAIQRLEREFLLLRHTSLDAMQENRDLKLKVRMLENIIMDLHVKNQDLEIRNNHSELGVTCLELTSESFFRVINKLNGKVAGLELRIAQRDLNRLTIRMKEMNSQMANVEVKFTQLKDEVNQLKVQFSNLRTKVKRETCANKLKGAIKDFKGCMTDVKQNLDQLFSDICEFSATVEDLETSDAVTELKMKVNNMEKQIIPLYAIASGLNNELVPLEKKLEMEHKEASKESTTGGGFEKFWEYLQRG